MDSFAVRNPSGFHRRASPRFAVCDQIPAVHPSPTAIHPKKVGLVPISSFIRINQLKTTTMTHRKTNATNHDGSVSTVSFSLLTLGVLSMLAPQAQAQGCVASRGSGACILNHGEDTYLHAGSWQATVGYRWLYSDKHFRGSKEETERQTLGTDVRNDSHFVDATLTYAISKRTSFSLTVPFVSSVRSSLYEHGIKDSAGKSERREMSASGLADIRLTSSIWIFDPETHHNGNLALGIGVKAPTGDSEAKDFKYKANGPLLDFVDQSIQPGDGGWGVILDAQGFQKIYGNASAYMQMSYLISPEELNGAYSINSSTQVKRYHSIPDSYLLRAGVSYAIWPSKGLSMSLGARMEGVPVEDLIGGSLGFRRPGYAISIEPGVSWMYKKFAFNVSVPVAVERNRQRSYIEIIENRPGGDAAFADYIITSSISYRF